MQSLSYRILHFLCHFQFSRNKNMFSPNHTTVTEFILLGLTDDPVLQKALFGVFLVIYLITVVGNLTMIVLIRTNPHLQIPIYFFLSHLSFVDLCYSSVIVTNMLVNLLSQNKSISYHSCALQFYFFCTFAIPNPLSWLPWRMTAMSPSVTLYCTRL